MIKINIIPRQTLRLSYDVRVKIPHEVRIYITLISTVTVIYSKLFIGESTFPKLRVHVSKV